MKPKEFFEEYYPGFDLRLNFTKGQVDFMAEAMEEFKLQSNILEIESKLTDLVNFLNSDFDLILIESEINELRKYIMSDKEYLTYANQIQNPLPKKLKSIN